MEDLEGPRQFVRGVVDYLVEVLTPPTTEPDFDVLSEFFSVEQTSGKSTPKEARGSDNRAHGHAATPPEPKWYSITEIAGGFTISRAGNVPMPADTSLKVSVAYDLPRADPLRDWSPIDFRIGNKDGELLPGARACVPDRSRETSSCSRRFNRPSDFECSGLTSTAICSSESMNWLVARRRSHDDQTGQLYRPT